MIKLVFDEALFGPNDVCAGVPCPNLPLLYRYVGVMIAVPIVTSLIGIAQTYWANQVGLHVMQDLRNRLYEHLQYMPLRFFTNTRTGEIQSRLSNDVSGVQSVVTDTASNVLANVVTIVSTLIAMVLLGPPDRAVARADATVPVADGEGRPRQARGRDQHAEDARRPHRDHRGDAR